MAKLRELVIPGAAKIAEVKRTSVRKRVEA